MKKIIQRGDDFVQEELTISDAEKLFTEKKQPYKLELIQSLKDKGTTKVKEEESFDIKPGAENVSIYKTGEFLDLCQGPHIKNSKDIGVFTLDRLAGAYFRGDEKNDQLQRVYGLAFETQKEMDEFLHQREEAEKRDHRKLGKELDLFTFSDLVGSGLPLWTPKGTTLRHILEDFVWTLRKEKGYERVEIPHITKKELYITSGHWDKFGDELFKVSSREDHEYVMKPMNCPHHTQIYKRKKWSYRDLPIRYANTTMVYRDEQSGELQGLSRVLAITQDDAHVFCRYVDIEVEFLKVWDIVDRFYSAFKFDLVVRLSFHDPQNKDAYLGSKETWENAEKILTKIAKKRGVKFVTEIGEAAFYGPKIDFVAKDSLKREWQVATIQLDMSQPESFDLTCTNEKGENERIVMIHAAITGSIERLLSILIEHYAGAFPVWLSPVQVSLLPVSDKHIEYVNELEKKFKEKEIRVEIDNSNETIGYKIRNAEKQKVPFMLVIGDKEVDSGTFSVRKRGMKETEEMSLEEFIKEVTVSP